MHTLDARGLYCALISLILPASFISYFIFPPLAIPLIAAIQ